MSLNHEGLTCGWLTVSLLCFNNVCNYVNGDVSGKLRGVMLQRSHPHDERRKGRWKETRRRRFGYSSGGTLYRHIIFKMLCWK